MNTQTINWREAILNADSTIQQVIVNLNQVALKIVLIVDDEGVLQGTISDGDIRRGLLRGLTLDSTIETLIHRNPLVVPEGLSRETVLQVMTANKIHQIPVVDGLNHVVGLHLWDQFSRISDLANQMVIMAGGKGTRLRPYTENCPKPLIPVGGKPMLEHILEKAKKDGFSNFVMAIHYLGHMIEEYFGDGSGFNVHIDYLREQIPLGTAGALSLLNPAPDKPFIVTNGDVLSDIHYNELLEFHMRHEATATMAVRLHEWKHPYGVVNIKGIDIIGFEEKPIYRTHVNAGVYVLNPVALSYLSDGESCDMPPLFDRIKKAGNRTVVYPMHEPWFDLGNPEDLQAANNK